MFLLPSLQFCLKLKNMFMSRYYLTLLNHSLYNKIFHFAEMKLINFNVSKAVNVIIVSILKLPFVSQVTRNRNANMRWQLTKFSGGQRAESREHHLTARLALACALSASPSAPPAPTPSRLLSETKRTSFTFPTWTLLKCFYGKLILKYELNFIKFIYIYIVYTTRCN